MQLDELAKGSDVVAHDTRGGSKGRVPAGWRMLTVLSIAVTRGNFAAFVEILAPTFILNTLSADPRNVPPDPAVYRNTLGG